jgi:hypothetical protein
MTPGANKRSPTPLAELKPTGSELCNAVQASGCHTCCAARCYMQAHGHEVQAAWLILAAKQASKGQPGSLAQAGLGLI